MVICSDVRPAPPAPRKKGCPAPPRKKASLALPRENWQNCGQSFVSVAGSLITSRPPSIVFHDEDDEDDNDDGQDINQTHICLGLIIGEENDDGPLPLVLLPLPLVKVIIVFIILVISIKNEWHISCLWIRLPPTLSVCCRSPEASPCLAEQEGEADGEVRH